MKTYFKQIDALRAWAVMTVVFGHMPVISGEKIKFISTLANYLPGVPLFFCISGFLITLIILNNRNRDWKNFIKSFYARRFLRIFPIYYLTILVLCVTIAEYRNWCIYDILYISNIKIGLMGSFEGILSAHFWSLAVEEQFYFLWPVLLILFRKKELLLIFSAFILGITITSINDYSFLMKRTFVPVCYLSGGGLLAYFYHIKPELLSQIKKMVLILFSLFLTIVICEYFEILKILPIIKFLISLIITPIVVLQFAFGFKNKILRSLFENKLIIHIGKISYGIYVYHVFAIYPALVIKKLTGLNLLDNPAMMQSFKIILTIIIASISWIVFEKRINNLKSRFQYI